MTVCLQQQPKHSAARCRLQCSIEYNVPPELPQPCRLTVWR
eukprot:COSAG02_NODE_67375_length_253_cov_0.668831_1_plen_40_part_10